MLLGLTIEANGWSVALAAVIIAGLGLLFWRRTGKVVVERLGSIEVQQNTAAIAATAAREAAVVTSLKTDNIQASIGVSNGQGPVVEMVERLTEGMAGMTHRISDIEHQSARRHEANKAAIAALGAHVSDIGTRLDELVDRSQS